MHLTKSTEQAICIMVMLYLQDRHVFLINDEVEIFALKTDYVSKIFEGALAVDKRYNKYLKKVNTVNKAIKSSLEDITIESLVEDILEENAKIRLDWNNWEDEFERVNVFFKG